MDDDDAETAQFKVQGAGGDGGDSRREDAEPTGGAIWGAPGRLRIGGGRRRRDRADEVEKEVLYEEIGRLKVELDWLKKKADLLG